MLYRRELSGLGIINGFQRNAIISSFGSKKMKSTLSEMFRAKREVIRKKSGYVRIFPS